MKDKTNTVIFWGAVWGIVEATLGYLIHSMNLTSNITGMIMFPIACYFMNKAYKNTGNLTAAMSTSGIAAGIKLINLLIPASIAVKVIHPALCILLEGAGVFVYLKLFENKKITLNYLGALCLSVSWRFIYLAYLYLIAFSFVKLPPLKDMLIKFIFIESVINSVIIYAYLKVTGTLEQETEARNIKLSLIFSISTLMLSIFIQILI